MRFGLISISLYLTGILIFLTIADFENVNWIKGYYLWDKTKDTLLISSIYYLLPKYRKSIKWAVIFSLVRVGAEAGAWIFGLNINGNHLVSSLFTVLVTIFIVLLLKDFPGWQKQK